MNPVFGPFFRTADVVLDYYLIWPPELFWSIVWAVTALFCYVVTVVVTGRT